MVSGNIANINTTGFKANGAVFEELHRQTARQGDLSRRDAQWSFVRDRSTWTDMSQGSIERTGNPLDVAPSMRDGLPDGADAERRTLHPQRRFSDQQCLPVGHQRRAIR